MAHGGIHPALKSFGASIMRSSASRKMRPLRISIRKIRKIVTPLANSEERRVRRGTYSVNAAQPSSPGTGSRLKMQRKAL